MWLKKVSCPEIGKTVEPGGNAARIDIPDPAPYHDLMKSRVVGIDPSKTEEGVLRTLGGILASDGVMAYPTETFYGLGAIVFSRKAVRRIFRLKERDAGKPLSLIVSDIDMIERIAAEPPPVFRLLAEEFWPGPLTLVLKAAPSFPEELAGPGHTIAVRIPPLAWLRELVAEIGLPLTATSANVSGKKEISNAADVIRLFNGKVDVIVDGGATPGGLPSTIVDLAAGEPRFLRDGAVPADAVLACFGLESRR